MKTIISKIAKGINFNLSENWHDEYNNSHTNDDEMIYVGWIQKYDFILSWKQRRVQSISMNWQGRTDISSPGFWKKFVAKRTEQ